MSVKINVHPTLLSFTGGQTVIEVNGSTVGECLGELVRRFPRIKPVLFDKGGKLFKYVDVFVNREGTYPEELAKPVKEGDELHITLIYAGG